MGYDFSKLNDREFEALGASIIEKTINKKVETFKAGKDGGVDGRFWLDNKEGIIQCKRYIETGYEALIRGIKKNEVPKIKKLHPKKYIFITTKKLSRLNKQEIKGLFKPYIKREDDIWGEDDLNNFLIKKENQDIVERHFKLWITSASILDIIFNHAIKGRSESSIKSIAESSHKYAITDNHNKGLNILENKNVLIITGEPGLGKTMLADNLALTYVAKGYEFCDIEENISEAENILREAEKKKILFYCDDFLGSNFYDAVNNKKDSHIVKFINRIKKDKFKKFILTSRTSILNKAYSLSHTFQNSEIRNDEFLLTVKKLTEIDKARILYNHIYHSNLDIKYIDKIYENKKYKNIIKHPNFNPRIIEFITGVQRVTVSSEQYWEYIQEKLENPKDIWAKYFQTQNDDSIRTLVFLTVFNDGQMNEHKLQDSYNTFLNIHPANQRDHSDKNFNAVIELATGALLNRTQITEREYRYTLFNPSIADFIFSQYLEDHYLIINILKSLETEESLILLKSLSLQNKKKITREKLQIIQSSLFDYFLTKKIQKEDWDFLILLSYFDFVDSSNNTKIIFFLETLVNTSNASGSRLLELLHLLINFKSSIKIERFDFLKGFIENYLDEDDLKYILEFIETFDINDDLILSKIESRLEDFLFERAYEVDIDYYYIDTDGIENEIKLDLNGILETFNSSALKRINIDISNIVFNLDKEALRRRKDYSENDTSNRVPDSSYKEDIDAIFER